MLREGCLNQILADKVRLARASPTFDAAKASPLEKRDEHSGRLNDQILRGNVFCHASYLAGSGEAVKGVTTGGRLAPSKCGCQLAVQVAAKALKRVAPRVWAAAAE